MATTKYGTWLTINGQNVFRTVIEYSVTSDGDTTATIQLVTKVQYGTITSWPGNVGRSATITATVNGNAATSTATLNFTRNGTQTLGTRSVTVTKTHATQSIDVRSYVSVLLNGTTAVGSLANGTQSVGAKKSYAVKFDANGGDAASLPAAQTKWYGETLKLSTTIPTRSGCTFLGWCTDKNGVGVNYDPGSNYTANAAVTLYAIWLGVSVPTIECERTDSEGAESDEGTYGTLAASWQAIGSTAADVTVTATNVTTGATITLDGDTTGSKAAQKSVTGNVSALFGADEGQAGTLDADTRYTIRVTVTATAKNAYSGQTVTARATAYVAYAYITMDFRVGGHGVSFGKTAVRDGFDVAMTPIYLGAAPTHDTDRSTSNAVNIITPNATDVTVTAAQAKTWGKVAQVYVRFTNRADLSVPASGNITNLTVGTLADAFRPAMVGAGQSYGDNAGQCWYYLSAGGEIQLGAVEGTGAARTIAAGTTFNCCLTYILA